MNSKSGGGLNDERRAIEKRKEEEGMIGRFNDKYLVPADRSL